MGKAYKTIAVYPEKCDGCGDCVTACLKAKSGTNPSQSRINPIKNLQEQFFAPTICLQCGDPNCVSNCPSGALSKNPDTGVVDWDEEKCVNCLLCTLACPYGGVTYDPVSDHLIQCDHCGGDPECVKVCKPKALEYKTANELYNQWGDLEDLFVPGVSACLGCAEELIMRHTLRRVGPDVVLATPPGCIAGSGAVGYNGLTSTKVPVFHPLLTNTAAMLAGARRYYKRIGRDVTMLALAGDGGTADVGFQSLSGAAERGEQMIFICLDNEGYMNTGVQRSGTTPYGAWTSTTPVGPALRGKTRDSKYMPLIMVMHNCEYVATASPAFMEDYYKKLDKAIEASKRGMAYIHMFSPCPTGWRFQPEMLIEVSRKAVETNVIPLWEFEYETKRIVFTQPVDNPLTVERYLSLVGKFRHLSKEQIDHFQKMVDQRIDILKSFSEGEGIDEVEALELLKTGGRMAPRSHP